MPGTLNVTLVVTLPSLGIGGANHTGAQGELAPTRKSSHVLICGGSNCTGHGLLLVFPAPRRGIVGDTGKQYLYLLHGSFQLLLDAVGDLISRLRRRIRRLHTALSFTQTRTETLPKFLQPGVERA